MSEQAISPEFAAGYREAMLQGLANEIEITKKVLAAIPEAKRDYRPDEHARTAWELAWHIANTDVQFMDGIADMNFKMEGHEGGGRPETVAELVEWYGNNCERGLARLRALTAQQLATPIDFMGVFNFPAVIYLGFLNNHSVHHRGQLATYLRPMGSKVPSIYGGSYDEPFQMPEAETTAA
jgi:uncharacterized damage-inducible protein DinB